MEKHLLSDDKESELSISSKSNDKFHRVTFILVLISSLGSFLNGYHMGFSSPTEDDIRVAAVLNRQQADLVFSSINVGAILGSLFAGKISNRIGRKIAIMLTLIPFAIGTLSMVFFITLFGLLFGRFTLGVAIGAISALVPLYIAEISAAHLRGSFSTIRAVFMTLGFVVVNILGLPTLTDPNWWKGMLLLTFFILAIMITCLWSFGVETPYWLITNEKRKEAKKVLKFLRPEGYDYESEYDDMVNGISLNTSVTKSKKRISFINIFSNRSYYMPILIVFCGMIFQQWSGINAVLYHTKGLFLPQNKHSSNTNTTFYLHDYISLTNTNEDFSVTDKKHAVYGAIGVTLVQTIMCLSASFMMDTKGRRFFILLSTFLMSFSSILVGILYYVDASQGWKILIMMIYIASFGCGMGPVPWVITGELFPSSIRASGISIATALNWFNSFLVTLSYSDLSEGISVPGTFWLYGTMCGCCCVFMYFLLPETKGKTLEDIDSLFDN